MLVWLTECLRKKTKIQNVGINDIRFNKQERRSCSSSQHQPSWGPGCVKPGRGVRYLYHQPWRPACSFPLTEISQHAPIQLISVESYARVCEQSHFPLWFEVQSRRVAILAHQLRACSDHRGWKWTENMIPWAKVLLQDSLWGHLWRGVAALYSCLQSLPFLQV